MEDRPICATDEHLEYLDNLRKSGVTNMLGAGSWLRDVFPELSKKEARSILRYWMDTFGKDNR